MLKERAKKVEKLVKISSCMKNSIKLAQKYTEPAKRYMVDNTKTMVDSTRHFNLKNKIVTKFLAQKKKKIREKKRLKCLPNGKLRRAKAIKRTSLNKLKPM